MVIKTTDQPIRGHNNGKFRCVALIMEYVGWVSSVILLCTLVKQVYKQWKEGTKEGVSKWLFTGQLAASIGFTIYSVLTGNVVFIVTNSLLVLNSIIGIMLYYSNKDPHETASD
jgi:MtN3 and saliva related transmembrane protein